MTRWLIVVFLALLLINAVTPWLQKLGFGRLPGIFGSRSLGVRFLFRWLLRSFLAWFVLGFLRCFELPLCVKHCGVYLLCSFAAARLDVAAAGTPHSA